MGKNTSRAKKSAGNQKQSDNSVAGSIKWLNRYKGYGFVQPEGGGPDLFVRRRICEEHKMPKRLKPGVRVRVEYGPGRPGECQAITRIELAA